MIDIARHMPRKIAIMIAKSLKKSLKIMLPLDFELWIALDKWIESEKKHD